MMAARKKKSVESSGKRKTAVARASVKAGKGRVRVNSEPIEILQPSLARRKSMEPLVIADAMNRLSKVDITITTNGGGIMGQNNTPEEAGGPQRFAWAFAGAFLVGVVFLCVCRRRGDRGRVDPN